MGLLAEVVQAVGTLWLPVLVLAISGRLLYNRYGRGISDIPGPFLASVSGLWLFVHYLRRKGLEERDLHRKYKSPLVRVSPDTISVSDAEAVRIIYGWKPIFTKVISIVQSGAITH
jgi:hypothetical protein